MLFEPIILAAKTVQNDPNVIIKPIAILLGFILNLVYDFLNLFSQNLSMGLSIIIFTIIVRALMVPLAVKQQKSMSGMQKIQPEMEKLKKKYGNTKDPEIQKKMNTEMQALYSKHGINPLSGCLPLIIQFPIFIALMYVMQQSFMFIKKVGTLYTQISDTILNLTSGINVAQYPAIWDMIKAKMGGTTFNIGMDNPGNFEKIINVMTPADWTTLMNAVPPDLAARLQPLLDQKNAMENFASLDMQSVPGWGVAGIVLLVLAVGVNLFSSWYMSRQQKSTDPNAKMTQRIMMIMMPAMMGYFTVTMPAGVGIYWLTSSVFQLVQQVILYKHFSKLNEMEAEAKAREAKAIEAKKTMKKTGR